MTPPSDRAKSEMSRMYMEAFVKMWTSIADERERHRRAIEDAIERLSRGAPSWEVVSRLRTHLDAHSEIADDCAMVDDDDHWKGAEHVRLGRQANED